jgi:hypothetical protein
MDARMNKRASIPIRRTEGLLVEPVGDETVVYDLETKEAHCLKPLAAAVFEYADGRRSTTDIAELAGHRLGTPVSEADLSEALVQLEHAALLDTPIVVRTGNGAGYDETDGISRRAALRRIGFAGATAAVATPLISSILAPTAAAAGSGQPTGCPCSKPPDCASNHCCQANAGKSCNQSCCVGGNNSCHIVSCVCAGGANVGNPCTVDGDCPGSTCSNCVCGVCATDFPGHTCPTPAPTCAGNAAACQCSTAC